MAIELTSNRAHSGGPQVAAGPIESTLVVPPLWCPIEPRVHPAVDQIEERIRPWFAGFGLDRRSLKRGQTSRAATWTCRVAPDGDEHRLQLFADWVCWAFVFDDYFTDCGPMMADPAAYNPMVCQMLAHLEHPELSPLDGNRFSLALRDLSVRMRACAPASLVQQWIADHYRWLLGSACSVSDRSAARIRSLDEHLIVGVLDRAEHITTLMIQFCEATDLPPRESARPHVQAITGAAQVLHAGYNDVASYWHERHQHSLESNLVHILQREHRCSPQDAMAEAVAVLDGIMLLFVELREQLARTAGPELCRYLDQLAHKIRGNSDFQRTAPRYTTTLDVDSATPQQAPAAPATPLYEYADKPSIVRRDPPARAISWWWDLLDR